MDELTNTLISVAQADVSSKISVAVARKALDQQKSSGEAAVALIQAAAEVGENVNGGGRGGVAGLGGLVDQQG